MKTILKIIIIIIILILLKTMFVLNESHDFLVQHVEQYELMENTYNLELEYVYDGDTVLLRDNEDTYSMKIRLLGVDTPEINSYSDLPPEQGAITARDFVIQTLHNKRIRIEYSKTAGQEAVDKYGRHLCYLYYQDINESEDKLLNLELIQKGLAKEYTYRGRRYEKQSEFRAAE